MKAEIEFSFGHMLRVSFEKKNEILTHMSK